MRNDLARYCSLTSGLSVLAGAQLLADREVLRWFSEARIAQASHFSK